MKLRFDIVEIPAVRWTCWRTVPMTAVAASDHPLGKQSVGDSGPSVGSVAPLVPSTIRPGPRRSHSTALAARHATFRSGPSAEFILVGVDGIWRSWSGKTLSSTSDHAPDFGLHCALMPEPRTTQRGEFIRGGACYKLHGQPAEY